HSIAVAGQYQTAFTLAQGGEQVVFIRVPGNGHYLHPKAEVAQPVGEQVYHRFIAHIPTAMRRANRGRSHQFGEKIRITAKIGGHAGRSTRLERSVIQEVGDGKWGTEDG